MIIRTPHNYQRKLFVLIIIATVVRIIVASSLELGNAEAYYWTYSLHLQWNYFDHPPIVAWLIRLTTANLAFHNEIVVRLGAIMSSAVCTWLMFKIGRFIHNVQTGWFAALLYTASVYCSIIAGTFILPDSPQMVFWLCSIFLMLKISRAASYNHKPILLWCLFGLVSGLCIMSKVHGVFLWLGVALYTTVINRSWLKHPGIYLSALISLIVVSPIFIWNLQNHFVSYTAYSSRVSVNGAGIDVRIFMKELLAVALISNPVNFFLICSNLLWVFKEEAAVAKKDIQVLLFCSVPLIVSVTVISLFRETLPHWPGPAYTSLLILPAIKLAQAGRKLRHRIPNSIRLALAFVMITAAAEVLVTNFYPGTSSEQQEGLDLGKDDFTLDMYGWEAAANTFDSLYKSDVSKKMMPAGTPIVVNSWYPAAHIEFYFAAKTKQQTVGIGDVFSLGQYFWMNRYKNKLKNGDSTYFIVPSDLFNYKNFDPVIKSFAHYEMPLVISLYRSGFICKKIYIFRLKGYAVNPE